MQCKTCTAKGLSQALAKRRKERLEGKQALIAAQDSSTSLAQQTCGNEAAMISTSRAKQTSLLSS